MESGQKKIERMAKKDRRVPKAVVCRTWLTLMGGAPALACWRSSRTMLSGESGTAKRYRCKGGSFSGWRRSRSSRMLKTLAVSDVILVKDFENNGPSQSHLFR